MARVTLDSNDQFDICEALERRAQGMEEAAGETALASPEWEGLRVGLIEGAAKIRALAERINAADEIVLVEPAAVEPAEVSL